MLSVGVANTAVHCADNEFVTIQPPSGKTCGQYLDTFVNATGGNLTNPDATNDCIYCSVSETNTFLAGVGSHYSERWRNFGLIWVYILVNIAAALFVYWLARMPKKQLKKTKVPKKGSSAQEVAQEGQQ
jgi:ABC-type multidrug transport system permease subunit